MIHLKQSSTDATKPHSSSNGTGSNSSGDAADSSHSPERDLLTVEQAAQYLHVSTSSIRSYIREGKLHAFRIAGLRKVLIARSALLDLLEPAQSADQ